MRKRFSHIENEIPIENRISNAKKQTLINNTNI